MEFKYVKDFISKHEKFIICAHESPDGDAIGSEYAMLLALRKFKKQALIFNADPAPLNFTFVDKNNEIKELESEEQLPEDISEYVLLIMDTNDIHNIGNIESLVLPKVQDYFIIDHHECDEKRESHLIIKEASSTSEMLFQLFNELKIKIDQDMARAMFMAIVYDTGSFIYPKTTALTFKIAHELVKLGIVPNDIYTKLYEMNSIPSIVLQSKVLGTLELHLDNHVAIQTMLKNTIITTGADYEEGRAIINIPLKANDVKVSIFFKENLEGILRCSLRSKEDIDIGKIARYFGGGGHRTAAGFKCKESLEKVKKKVLSQLEEYFNDAK